MEKFNTQEAIDKTMERGFEIARKSDINVSNDEFTIVQPFDDTNAIIISVEEDEGERTIKVKVTDTVVVLEKQSGTLDCFK